MTSDRQSIRVIPGTTTRRMLTMRQHHPEPDHDETPHLVVLSGAEPVAGVAILLHGGRERSREPVAAWRAPVLRMRPFAPAIRRENPRIVVGLVRNRYRGWNEPAAHPVADAEHAVAVLSDRYAGVPIVLVGHSMGGRAAVRAAGAPAVSGVVALAPWLPIGEPVEQLTGRALVLVHGSRDHTTSPGATAAFAVRAEPFAREVVSLRVAGTGHTMLRRARLWHHLAAAFVAAMIVDEPLDGIATGAGRVTATPAGSR